MKGERVAFQTGLYRARSVLFVLQIVETVDAVTVVAELPIGKAITIPAAHVHSVHTQYMHTHCTRYT